MPWPGYCWQGAAGLEELAGLVGADGELDDPQPAASATQASTATTHPARGVVTGRRPTFRYLNAQP